jgi:hypothetical protein
VLQESTYFGHCCGPSAQHITDTQYIPFQVLTWVNHKKAHFKAKFYVEQWFPIREEGQILPLPPSHLGTFGNVKTLWSLQ